MDKIKNFNVIKIKNKMKLINIKYDIQAIQI